jgi:hypothetical protein
MIVAGHIGASLLVPTVGLNRFYREQQISDVSEISDPRYMRYGPRPANAGSLISLISPIS